jgi:ribosomal protein S6
MVKISPKTIPFPIYNLWIVLKEESSNRTDTQIYEFITKLIAESGGSISFPTQHGRKSTFFTKSTIRHKKKGKYISFTFISSPEVLPWLNQFLNLSDLILRFIMIKK